MDLLRDKDRRFSSYLLKFLKKAGATSEDYWKLGRQLPETFVISFPSGLGERDTYWVFYKNNEIV